MVWKRGKRHYIGMEFNWKSAWTSAVAVPSDEDRETRIYQFPNGETVIPRSACNTGAWHALKFESSFPKQTGLLEKPTVI